MTGYTSLLIFSTMGLTFIYLLQVNDIDRKVMLLEHNNASHSRYKEDNLKVRDLLDTGQLATATPTYDSPRQLTKHTSPLKQTTVGTAVSFTALTSRLHVFGVYMDQRFQPRCFMRILVLQEGDSLTDRLACGTQGAVFNTWADRYEMCENHGKRYSGWIYSCLVPQDTRPDFRTVDLSVYDDEGSLINTSTFHVHFLGTVIPHLTVNSSKPGGQQVKGLLSRNVNMTKHANVNESISFEQRDNISIGVCVPPVHGNIHIPDLINFLELCWTLGANRVFLYIYDLPDDLLQTLRRHLSPKSHLLETIHWYLPPNITAKSSYQVIWNNGQLLAIQHCLYQNMALFDWLLFLDIDEMLIPRNVYTWQDLVKAVLKDSTGHIAALSFESAFFTQGFDTDGYRPIKYFQHLHRTKRTSARHSKLLVQPKLVFEAGIHHLSRAVKNSMRVIQVPSDTALIHHYRRCAKTDTEEHIQCDLIIKDTTALKYEPQLMDMKRKMNQGSPMRKT
ncbi:hypothetical protein Btru_049827 [Bulinus truncatus]|nr:hypothetical protein Btru_049827 [Bulinus truncatus]